MVKIVNTVALHGIDGLMVSVESSYRGKTPEPKIELIGLPDTAVREALGRVRSAAAASGFTIFSGLVTVNLAPADVKKEGSMFDLPILLSLLDDARHGNIDFDGKCFIGELSLNGMLRRGNGALCAAVAARDNGFREIYLPAENAAEASAATGIDVYGVESVEQLYNHLTGRVLMERTVFSFEALRGQAVTAALDFREVRGQENAKKALEIAAAGSHNLLMIGPPGSGKSMLAGRLPSIMPGITLNEAIETTKIHSIAGALPSGTALLPVRPFRSPHHTISAAALAGGGKFPKPGEISLAHNGVLFLDEFPEFDKNTAEVLRQPLEERKVNITRVSGTVSFPCAFMLVCAMNPCQCGFFGHPAKKCVCSDFSRKNYISKISGPLLDRIDIQIEIPPVEYTSLTEENTGESSADIRKRVKKAREFAAARFGSKSKTNAFMNSEDIEKYCRPDAEGQALLAKAFESLSLSARSYVRIIKVSRTIADLDGSEQIKRGHVAMALQLRSLDKKYFS